MAGRLKWGGFVVAMMLGLGAMPAHAQPADGAPAEGTGTVTGTVLDAKSAEPIIDAGVEVVGKGRSTRTDLDGRYTFKLPPGTYEIRIFAAEYQAARLEKVTIVPNGVFRGDASLNPLTGKAAVEVV